MTFAVENSLFAAEEAQTYAEEIIMRFARTLDPDATLESVQQINQPEKRK